MAVTPPHSGVQPPPPDTTNARLNCFTPVACAVETRLNGGYRLVSTYGANPAVPPDGDLADADGDELAELLGAVPADLVGEGVAEPLGERGAERLGVGDTGDTDGAELRSGFRPGPHRPLGTRSR